MNNYIISQLKNLYSGKYGEIFCNLQFSYFAYMAEGLESVFADVFLNILKDEQRHQKILGQNIVLNGGDLNFDVANCKGLYFTKNIKNMLENAIDLKEKCIINYKMTLTKISNSQTNNILKNVLTDEQKHILLLRDALKKYDEVAFLRSSSRQFSG